MDEDEEDEDEDETAESERFLFLSTMRHLLTANARKVVDHRTRSRNARTNVFDASRW